MNEDGDTSDPEDPKQSFGITRRATAYMEKQVREGHPFFLQLSYYAPHSKPQALASTLRKYEGSDTSNGGGGKGGRDSGAIMAAMTEDLDTCIGDLVAKLEQLGIAKKTYIIYMSDNGGSNQILKGGKALVDEGGLRVPLIVHGPGIQGGTYCHEPVVGYDILSTVLDFVAPGFELPKGVEGGSWKTVLMNAGKGTIQRPIDRLVFHHDVEVSHPQTAMRKGNLKLVHYWDTKESFLYDLSTDLSEQTNLAAAKPAIVTEMLVELKAHLKNGLDAQRFAALESGQFRGNDRPKGQGGKGKGDRGKRFPGGGGKGRLPRESA
jgi:arylsulfatase A-like enzyme